MSRALSAQRTENIEQRTMNNKNKFRFLDWQMYKDAKELLSFVIKLVKKLPKEYRFEIGSQLIRAALSVVLNVAEGSARRSDKEMNRFLNIALGSLHEVLAVIDILRPDDFITNDEFNAAFRKIDSIDNQLGGFKKKLQSSMS